MAKVYELSRLTGKSHKKSIGFLQIPLHYPIFSILDWCCGRVQCFENVSLLNIDHWMFYIEDMYDKSNILGEMVDDLLSSFASSLFLDKKKRSLARKDKPLS
jgi:hypothetical protein